MDFVLNDWGQRYIINRITTLTKQVSDMILNQFVKWWSSHKMTEVKVTSWT